MTDIVTGAGIWELRAHISNCKQEVERVHSKCCESFETSTSVPNDILTPAMALFPNLSRQPPTGDQAFKHLVYDSLGISFKAPYLVVSSVCWAVHQRCFVYLVQCKCLHLIFKPIPGACQAPLFSFFYSLLFVCIPSTCTKPKAVLICLPFIHFRPVPKLL